jgi:type IV secretion system protein VirB2
MTLDTQIKAMNRTAQVVAAIGIGMILAGPAHAAGSGMPWEGPLDQILASIEGPVARIVAVIIIRLR